MKFEARELWIKQVQNIPWMGVNSIRFKKQNEIGHASVAFERVRIEEGGAIVGDVSHKFHVDMKGSRDRNLQSDLTRLPFKTP